MTTLGEPTDQFLHLRGLFWWSPFQSTETNCVFYTIQFFKFISAFTTCSHVVLRHETHFSNETAKKDLTQQEFGATKGKCTKSAPTRRGTKNRRRSDCIIAHNKEPWAREIWHQGCEQRRQRFILTFLIKQLHQGVGKINISWFYERAFFSAALHKAAMMYYVQ